MAFKAKILGMLELKSKMNLVLDKKKAFVIAEVMNAHKYISSTAKSNLGQVPDDGLRNIYASQHPITKGQSFYVNWDDPHAAYWEFGTGSFANVFVPTLEPWWREYATSFYINGLGRTPTHNVLYPVWIEQITLLIENLVDHIND